MITWLSRLFLGSRCEFIFKRSYSWVSILSALRMQCALSFAAHDRYECKRRKRHILTMHRITFSIFPAILNTKCRRVIPVLVYIRLPCCLQHSPGASAEIAWFALHSLWRQRLRGSAGSPRHWRRLQETDEEQPSSVTPAKVQVLSPYLYANACLSNSKGCGLRSRVATERRIAADRLASKMLHLSRRDSREARRIIPLDSTHRRFAQIRRQWATSRKMEVRCRFRWNHVLRNSFRRASRQWKR